MKRFLKSILLKMPIIGKKLEHYYWLSGKVIDESYFKKTDKKKYNQEECLKLLESSYFKAALVFRSLAIKDKLFQTTKIASDFILDLLITNHGDLFYLDEKKATVIYFSSSPQKLSDNY